MSMARSHGATLAGRSDDLGSKLQPIDGPFKTLLGSAECRSAPPPLNEIKQRSQRKARWKPLRQSNAACSTRQKLPTTTIAPSRLQFGTDLTIVGLSGKWSSIIVGSWKRPGPLNLAAGLCNDVFGYFPSSRVLSEGGRNRGLYSRNRPLFPCRARRAD